MKQCGELRGCNYGLLFFGGGWGERERRVNFTAVERHFLTSSWKAGVPCPPSTWAMTKAKFAAKAGAGRAACRHAVPQPAAPSSVPPCLHRQHLAQLTSISAGQSPELGMALCRVWDRGVCALFAALEHAMDDSCSPPSTSIFAR